MAGEEKVVWVCSDITTDGAYTATIHVNDDVSVSLTPGQARQYAGHVYAVAGAAEHDAAVLRQLVATDMEFKAAGMLILELRQQRPPYPAPPLNLPVRFEPIVSATTQKPYVHGFLAGAEKAFTQWSPDDARGHAGYVLAGTVAAALDTAYYRMLRDEVGLEDGESRAAVAMLAEFRTPGEKS